MMKSNTISRKFTIYFAIVVSIVLLAIASLYPYNSNEKQPEQDLDLSKVSSFINYTQSNLNDFSAIRFTNPVKYWYVAYDTNDAIVIIRSGPIGEPSLIADTREVTSMQDLKDNNAPREIIETAEKATMSYE